jgi:hypothetical protein
VAKAAVDVVTMKTADQGAAAARTIVGSVGSRFGSGSSSSPAPTTGSKRVAMLGGSTPPSKWSRCT